MGKPRNGLTPKQDKFARAYVKHGNGAKAARIAGYSVKADKETASENLTKPNIQARIAELEADAAIAAGLTEEQIKAGILKIALSDEEQGGTRNRSWELLGKSKGMFKDVQVTETESMSTGELLEAIRALLGDQAAENAAQMLGLDMLEEDGTITAQTEQ
jgi:phage terminase small subunit